MIHQSNTVKMQGRIVQMKFVLKESLMKRKPQKVLRHVPQIARRPQVKPNVFPWQMLINVTKMTRHAQQTFVKMQNTAKKKDARLFSTARQIHLNVLNRSVITKILRLTKLAKS